MRLLWWAVLIGCLAAAGFANDPPRPAGATPVDLAPRIRQPVALVLADRGQWLFAANRRSGTISVIDTQRLQCVAEVAVGRSLSGLAVIHDGSHLLATDEDANELILLSRQGPSLTARQRLAVSPAPVSLQVAGDGSRCFVASLWSRQLTVVEVTPGLRVAATIALPFAPREQVLVGGGTQLVVADSFGGQLATVDLGRGEVRSVRTLPAHNIRGLALSGDGRGLLVIHQTLNGRANTSFDDIHWGNLITNVVRVLPLAGVLDRDADLLRDSRLHQLGDVARGAADPASVAVGRDGMAVVALAGVGEVALGPGPGGAWQRLAVGRRPTAVRVSPDGRRAYVANTFADSVSVVDLSECKVEAEVALGPRPEPSPSDVGEQLFYDARLTHDSWFSCHSCHTDGHTNGLLSDTLGDGSFGTPKRILSLRGVGDTSPWAWDGGQADLEGQVRKSIRTTMHGPKPSDGAVEALTAYLRTLAPPPSLAKLRGDADEARVRRGQVVFREQGCATCHVPPAYTASGTYDVGISDEAGNRRFNPPSLRGIGQGGPFFHDNRAATLDEVFAQHRHQLRGELDSGSLGDLLAFLRSL
jgi:YVTN family beta-propeller protein